jgi:DNA gyrase subunit A
MLGMEISNGNGDLVVMTENGFGKRTPVIEYPEHKRGGQGVLTIAMNERKGALVACRVVGPQHELMIVSESGVMIRVKATDISKLGRATQGVRVMNLGEGDRVASMARMVVSKKKPPKRKAGAGEGQAMMDLALAGAIEDTDTVDEVDLGVEEFDESLLDD